MTSFFLRPAAAALVAAVLLAGCEKPPMDSTQAGFRGLAMGTVTNPRITGPIAEAQLLPTAVPEVPSAPGGPLAKDVFKNVKVLGDVPLGEFTRTMLAITAWVSPKEGCNYCHKEGEDLSLDTLYTKVVARKMLEMTLRINTDWQPHVKETGVTCYTCHRGQAVPAEVWFDQPRPRSAGGATPEAEGHNYANPVTALSAIDNNVLVRYLLGNESLRSGGTAHLPTQRFSAPIQQTENTFGLMMYMSKALGSNCTLCHNTRSHTEWAESPPQRVQAWHGIQMARQLNLDYMVPLTGSFPASRLGPKGDVAKVACGTCHQGLSKPLNGAPLLKDHPVLGPPAAAAAAAPVVDSAATAATSVGTGSVKPVAVRR